MAVPTTPVTRPFVATAPAISVAVTSAASTAVLMPGTGSVVRIVNEGPSIAFFALGSNATSLAATTPTTGSGTAQGSMTSNPVLPGADVSFTRDPKLETFISAICRAGGTAQLDIQTGEGN